MSDTNKRIRVFVGSPGDVAEERDAVSDVIERLNSKLDRDGAGVFFQTIRWEKYAHLRDTRFTPQAAIASGIPRPRDCDVAVFIFWRRIGTVLDMTGLEPNGAGDRPTGSTWEFYDALESPGTKVLTYRKMAPAPVVRDESSARFEERQRQERAVHQLFESLRNAEGSFKRYWHNFEHPAEFRADLGEQLEIIAKQVSSDLGSLSEEQDAEKLTPTVNPPVRSEEPLVQPSAHPPVSNSEKNSKPPITRWLTIGSVAVVLIGIIGWYGIDPPPIAFPKPDLVPIPSHDFSISRHEITFAQYDHFAKETETRLPDDLGWGREDRPVIYVNAADAQTYARWLSEQLGQECRLPSEREWQDAAQAGGSGEYGLGEGDEEITRDNLGDFAWYSENSRGQTQSVGTRKPNAFGLYDMFGNVWEWCGDDRTICGGAWDVLPDALRAAFRDRFPPGHRLGRLGFRVVCVPHR